MMINFPDYDFGQTTQKTNTVKESSSHELLFLSLGLLLGYSLFKTDPHNYLEGGKGDKTDPEKVDQNELKKGLKIEMEHTNDPSIAKEIAVDHLTEDSKYYTHLEAIHKENPIEDLLNTKKRKKKVIGSKKKKETKKRKNKYAVL